MNLNFATLAAAASPPAGGAELTQVAIATLAATLVTCALLFLGLGHRSGRTQILQRLADFGERSSGFPGWVAFPPRSSSVSPTSANDPPASRAGWRFLRRSPPPR